MTMPNATANGGDNLTNSTSKRTHEDVECYPRHERAPYLYDISDFGIRPSTSQHYASHDGDGGEGWDPTREDPGDRGGAPTGASPPKAGGRTLARSASSSSFSTPLKRRSSWVFSKLGMSTRTIDEDEDDDGGGRGRDRRDSSAADAAAADEGGGGTAPPGGAGRGAAGGRAALGKIPRWALRDPAAIVMRGGHPIPMGVLLHHHALLHGRSAPGAAPPLGPVTPTWRLKERMKTVGVCLVLALNIGTDPPDLHKPTPCAKLQCWLDPTAISRAKAKERIGERLEQQYARWQQRAKLRYRRALDPTVDAVKELCLRMREAAKGERVLLHYNGHGVPRPTTNGEIWLFDKHHTNYIPLSVADLRRWLGRPSVVVLDCSGAGVLLPFFAAPAPPEAAALGGRGGGSAAGHPHAPPPSQRSYSVASDPTGAPDAAAPLPGGKGAEYLKAIRDTIVLCPTAQGEWLPLHPEFPADIFASCLTTPIPMALRWFVHQTPLSTRGWDLETIADDIPGKLTDRKTPLGELNWIFTAITDTIAWNVLPSPLFQRLFRQDLLVASMFRNFLLADRILRSFHCTPMSHPELPSTCHHPLWKSWDLAVETCLTQLSVDKGPGIGGGVAEKISPASEAEGGTTRTRMEGTPPGRPGPAHVSPTPPVPVHAPFFAEQLTAFEIWLEWASSKPRNKLVIRTPPSAVGGTPLPFLQGMEDANQASHELDPPQELPIGKRIPRAVDFLSSSLSDIFLIFFWSFQSPGDNGSKVLQVLLSQAHRVRALVLLRRFLDLGPSAVNLALSVGIFPYVLKLLQSPIDEYKVSQPKVATTR